MIRTLAAAYEAADKADEQITYLRGLTMNMATTNRIAVENARPIITGKSRIVRVGRYDRARRPTKKY